MLLSGLGVPDEIFVTLQEEHLERVGKMLFDQSAALVLLEWQNMANILVELDHSEVASNLRALRRRLIAEAERLRIVVPKSRTLFGVAETPRFCASTGCRLPGLLRPGECLVRVTMNGKLATSIEGHIVVSKNPCYLLGDIRVLHAISSKERPELHELEKSMVDCIVFPIEGPVPHHEQIAGSDLVSTKSTKCGFASMSTTVCSFSSCQADTLSWNL